MEFVDISIKWPFKWCLVGSSGSGKTVFSLDLVKHMHRLVDQPPSKIVLIFKEYQKIYDEFNNYFPTEAVSEEDADIDFITKDNKERLLLICDDLYFSKKLDDIAQQFLVKGRHRNTSWLVLTQSIFNRPALINISRNCNHITLFKTVRLNEPHIFFSQLRPKSSKVLQNIFAKATESSFSYIDIDLSQTCPDKYRYKGKLFDKFVEVFVIMNENTFKKMYLVSESYVKGQTNHNYRNDNFKISLENKDICNNGMNISVKPIKKKNTITKVTNENNFLNGDQITPVNDRIDESDETLETVTTKDKDKEKNDSGNTNETENVINNTESIEHTNDPPLNNSDKSDSVDNSFQKKNEESLKRKPLPLNDDSHFQLKRAKQFKPYPFLEQNDGRSLLEDDTSKADEAKKETSELKSITSNNKQDSWIDGIKSRINDRKVQFKRKQDSAGFRIAPEEVKNSLIKPGDFSFLSPVFSLKNSRKNTL